MQELHTTSKPIPKKQRIIYLSVAILLGLSWFIVAFGGNILGNTFHLSNNPWINTSIGRLIIGVLLYLVLVPLIIARFTKDNYFKITGLYVTRQKLLLVLSFIFLPLILTVLLRYSTAQAISDYSSLQGILASIQPPLVEEVLMRGLFVYLLLKAHFSWKVIIPLGAFIFSLYHVLSFGASGFLTGVLSIPLMFIPRFLTGGVMATIPIHAYTNENLGTPALLAVLLIEIACLGIFLARKHRSRAKKV